MATVVMTNGASRPTLVVPSGGLGGGRKHRSGGGRSGGLFRGRQQRQRQRRHRTVVAPAAALEHWDPEQVRVVKLARGRWRAAPN